VIGLVDNLMAKIDIIIPVYSGYEVTKSCLESVFCSVNLTDYEVIVVYDFGPDLELEAFVDQLYADRKITLLKNSENLGFVATANRGMRCHENRNVILLNSDTIVANDWIDRILQCAELDSKISTVTPFSSNAEICSFPRFCKDNSLPMALDVKAIDTVFAERVDAAALDIPTGVGFCMYISRASLTDIGYFDESSFGRGYGEENDFCRRAAVKGWRNVHCTNVFVFHEGGVSFSDEKQALVENAMQVLDRMHPDYHRLVHEFLSVDPAKAYRIQAFIEMFRASRLKRIVMLTHDLGGGTLKHVKELVGGLEQSIVAVWLRPTEHGLLLQFGFEESCDTLVFDNAGNLNDIVSLLTYMGVDSLHIHHIKGFDGYVETLAGKIGCPYEITLHDYYMINGSPTLTDETGRFCDDIEIRDEICERHSPVPLGMDALAWREKSEALLNSAQRIISPSQYTKNVFLEYFPHLNITVAPHFDHEIDTTCPDVKIPIADEEFRITVIGALGIEKGADILEQVAELCRLNKMPFKFSLIGYAYRDLSDSIETTGPYKDEDLPEKLAAFNPHLVWFPCQWPETYSYTLSHCLREGLSILAPNFGSFGERLAGRPFSWLEDYRVEAKGWVQKIDQIYQSLVTASPSVREATLVEPWPGQTDSRIYYGELYAKGIKSRARLATPPFSLSRIQVAIDGGALELDRVGKREQLLLLLVRLRSLPILRRLQTLVPYRIQRSVKRFLSRRPIHEL
jgi:GT2 family glycosyltransferase